MRGGEEMSPRNLFEKQLAALHKDVEKMGLAVEKNYDDLFEALEKRDEDGIVSIMKNDRIINDMQRGIEAQCLSLITKQQPVAKDLRLVTASLKVVTDIERIGDHCSDIAELFIRLNSGDLSFYSTHIKTMIEETKKLEHAAVDAFATRDTEAAKKVIDGDDIVDDLFNKVKEDLVEHLKKETANVDECIDVLMIAKYLEKIGDHAVNIGEWEIFQETGTIADVRLL